MDIITGLNGHFILYEKPLNRAIKSLARDEGIEPPTQVLETYVIPLNQSRLPKFSSAMKTWADTPTIQNDVMSRYADSNCRPFPYHGNALPTELCWLVMIKATQQLYWSLLSFGGPRRIRTAVDRSRLVYSQEQLTTLPSTLVAPSVTLEANIKYCVIGNL